MAFNLAFGRFIVSPSTAVHVTSQVESQQDAAGLHFVLEGFATSRCLLYYIAPFAGNISLTVML